MGVIGLGMMGSQIPFRLARKGHKVTVLNDSVASLSPSVVLILGFANLLADGFSMSIGNYLATKTRHEYIDKERKREKWEIENMVEEEKQEIRDIYARKGFKDALLEDVVGVITKKQNVWVDTMMREELGLIESKGRALDNALNTFIGFNVMGLIPLIPFIFLMLISSIHITANPFFYSVIFTGIAFFSDWMHKRKSS